MGAGSTLQSRRTGGAEKGDGNDSGDRILAGGAVGQIIRRLQRIERLVSAEKGDFTLFGLFLREGSPGRWDLLVSAKWIDADEHEAIRTFADLLQQHLTRQQLLVFSHIHPVRTQANDFLQALQRKVGNVEHGLVEVRGEIAGMLIEQGYVISFAGPHA